MKVRKLETITGMCPPVAAIDPKEGDLGQRHTYSPFNEDPEPFTKHSYHHQESKLKPVVPKARALANWSSDCHFRIGRRALFYRGALTVEIPVDSSLAFLRYDMQMWINCIG
ncbi:hypothetical protein CEXT_666351 [Caerostris extrusa]|uniref:Uncharacterized protein n=1 Tax=Caerostris extrusa TaxID=172846 RepID=A0AAV4MZY0_CAEEX|nr:hypothetical protein CEXT_666351 [Caerostris extrusa]